MSKQFIIVTRLNGDVVAVNVSKIVEIAPPDEDGANALIVLEACGISRHYRCFSVLESMREVLMQFDEAFN